MKTLLSFTLLILLMPVGSRAQNGFDTCFEKKSLRVDFVLSGNDTFQSAALLQLREEPHWGGPVENLIDGLNYGGYYVNMYDRASGKLIYSRGFNTLFEEWRTTEQAAKETQAWTNSMSVPYPRSAVVLEITGRDKADMQFHPLLKMEIDPASIFIDRSKLKDNKVTPIQHKGEPASKVDLVFIGDGYTAAEQDLFMEDARLFTESLFGTAPFDGRRDDFNVWAVNLVSEDSGTDISGEGIYKNTALNTGFYTFGVSRYLTTPDMKSIRDAVWNVPCDAVFILVNSERYGGGGMYNFYAIGTAHNQRTREVFVHELGHSFAGLADEYYQSEVAYDEANFYNIRFEPWEPNITTLVDFGGKWKGMLPAGTPVPTPLDDAHRHGLGVFEGAGYLPKGIYRPVDHCMMRDLVSFCPVCSRAILNMVDFMTGRPYQK